jgi:hypothetical protein
MELSIYIPEESINVFRFHINQLAGRSFDEWTFFNDPETFRNSARGKRIACFQIPYPYDNKIEHQLADIYDSVDVVIILGSELHEKTIEFIKRYDWAKINYFICGYLHWRMLNAKVFKFLDWFTTSLHFYKNVRPSILYELRAFDAKPLQFDALLGRKKPHRDLAYKFLQDNNMMDQGVVTYANDYQLNFEASTSEQWQWESTGVDNIDLVAKTATFTVDRVDYYGYNMSISQIMPLDIYNRTAYSLVCETNFDNQFVFLTEKTVKPMLARRLFITLGNQFHLAALRRLGFKTFDNIIDESYDAIENPTERHTRALEQLRWLCEQPQDTILERARETIEHNYNHLYSHDWYNLFKLDFGDIFFSQRTRII